MNKKLKVLSSVICGLVLSYGIALTSVQAAPAQLNSAAISMASTSQEYLLKGRITAKGLLYWETFDGVENYEIRIIRLVNVDGGYTNVKTYKGMYTDGERDVKAAFTTTGFYIIKIKGLDSNDNVIIQDVLFVDYDGTQITI